MSGDALTVSRLIAELCEAPGDIEVFGCEDPEGNHKGPVLGGYAETHTGHYVLVTTTSREAKALTAHQLLGALVAVKDALPDDAIVKTLTQLHLGDVPRSLAPEYHIRRDHAVRQADTSYVLYDDGWRIEDDYEGVHHAKPCLFLYSGSNVKDDCEWVP